MVKSKKNKKGLSEKIAIKKGGVTKLNPFDVRTGVYIYSHIQYTYCIYVRVAAKKGYFLIGSAIKRGGG